MTIKKLLSIIFSLLLLLTLFLLLKFFRIQFNDTSSMPIGFYREIKTSTIKRGDLVAVCLPSAIAAIGLRQNYLTHGNCPSGTIAVLKEVIAIPHDAVILTDQSITVNHLHYLALKQSFDHNHHCVKKFISNGTYKNIHTYWLYGSHSPQRSWDSRYYGGVSQSNILGVYKPVFVF